MEEWINAVATFLGIIVASIISLRLYRADKQNSADKEIFDKFYVPYILMIYTGITMADYSEYNKKKQKEFCDFLKSNIQLADAEVQKKIFQFCQYQLFSEDDSSNQPITGYDNQWSELNQLIVCKYEKLCAELGYASLLNVHL